MSQIGETTGWAALGVMVGGGMLKLFEMMFKNKLDDAAAIRKELREDIRLIKQDLIDANREVEVWREKYFILQERFNGLVARMTAAGLIDHEEAITTILQPREEHTAEPQEDSL